MQTMAAEQLPGEIHSYEDFDTEDYCLNIHNVSIGMQELKTIDTEEQLKVILMEAAAPRILIRDRDPSALILSLP